jgi:hypothetical protein
MFGKFAERENETFVMALCVFSTKAAASEYLRHNPGVGRRTREVSGGELANVIESSGLNHVVVNPLPIAPAGPAPEDVRPSKEFVTGLRD